jgi:hypothetical protein
VVGIIATPTPTRVEFDNGIRWYITSVQLDLNLHQPNE